MKFIAIILSMISFLFSSEPLHITSDLNNVFLHNHKSYGEFERDYGTYSRRIVKVIHNTDALTGQKFDVPKVIYEYTNFTYMYAGKLVIRLDITEDPILGDHQITDILVIVGGKQYRNYYKETL